MTRPPPRSTLFPYPTVFRSKLEVEASRKGVTLIVIEKEVTLLGRRKVSETPGDSTGGLTDFSRSEEHTSELQSLRHLVCRLLLEKKNKKTGYRSQQRVNDSG